MQGIRSLWRTQQVMLIPGNTVADEMVLVVLIHLLV